MEQVEAWRWRCSKCEFIGLGASRAEAVKAWEVHMSAVHKLYGSELPEFDG